MNDEWYKVGDKITKVIVCPHCLKEIKCEMQIKIHKKE